MAYNSDDDKPFWQIDEKSRQAVDNISSHGSIGSTTSGPAKAFFGINHRQTPGVVPMNKDQIGYTFFTRPLMNMTDENLRADRRLALLLNKNNTSFEKYMRCAFDLKIARSRADCPIFDNYQAFIPILSNFIESSSGWPDAMGMVYQSPEGQYKESFSFYDGPLNLNGTYDINCTFRNILGDPITDLFYYWILYGALQFEDRIVSYPTMWWENEIDYMTRIYRVIMDQEKRKVRGILSADAAYPLNAPLGQRGNFERGTPFNRENDLINITFRTNGLTYNDPILFDEFNAVVCMFNPAMKEDKREQIFRKIPPWALTLFNFSGYPRINTETAELEWWIEKAFFYSIIDKDQALAIDPEGEAEVESTDDRRTGVGGRILG